MVRTPRLESAFEPADAFIGIATTIPVIQLVHFINQKTILNLIREEDLPVYIEKAESLHYFKFFHYQNEDYRSDFCLLCNSASGIVLLPTHKQFSFFLIIQGAIPEDKIAQLVFQIKSIAGVQLAALINQGPIRSLGPILQDLEIYLSDLKKSKMEMQKRIMPLSEDQ